MEIALDPKVEQSILAKLEELTNADAYTFLNYIVERFCDAGILTDTIMLSVLDDMVEKKLQQLNDEMITAEEEGRDYSEELETQYQELCDLSKAILVTLKRFLDSEYVSIEQEIIRELARKALPYYIENVFSQWAWEKTRPPRIEARRVARLYGQFFL